MKKITFLAIACCLVTSVFAQNCDAPFDILATNTTMTSVGLGWNVPQTAVVALTSENYANYTDAKNMRIFAKEGVSISFLANTGATYEAMFADGTNIDATMRASFLEASNDYHVYQRLGLEVDVDATVSGDLDPPLPFGGNATDFIWENVQGGPGQIGEVIEHLLHTVTSVVLYGAFEEAWDFDDLTSAVSLAMQEAIDAGVYDISSYSDYIDEEFYRQIVAQEYAYWLILAEWDYYVTAGKQQEGMTGNEEFTLGTPSEILTQLPLGHALYENYIAKILTVPSKTFVETLFPLDASWNIEYGITGYDQGSAQATLVATSTNVYEISRLTPDTSYDIYVQTNCGLEDGLSEWTGPLTIYTEDSSLGMDTVSKSNFTYFPNPVNNVLSIKAQASIDSITVYNMLGQTVVRSTPNTTTTTVDMSGLQTGAYFVQVAINNSIETVRVIKN